MVEQAQAPLGEERDSDTSFPTIVCACITSPTRTYLRNLLLSHARKVAVMGTLASRWIGSDGDVNLRVREACDTTLDGTLDHKRKPRSLGAL